MRRRRWVVVAALCVWGASGCAPALARAQAAETDDGLHRIAVAVEQRVVLGFDDVSELRLSLTGLGADVRLAPTLTLRGLLLLMVPVGTTEAGDAADVGGGGELSLRMEPWPQLDVRPYLWWGAGLFFFPEAFLPGGTRYDFIIGFGGGVDVSVTERLVLGASANVTHLSNGQGLGAHNPAYDGIAFGLSGTWSLAPRAELSSVWDEHPPHVGGRERWTPGITAEGFVGELDSELYTGGKLHVAERLARPLVAVLDLDAGSYASEAYIEMGLALVAHLGPASLGARGGHRWWAGIRTWAATVQAEWHVTPEVTLVAMGHHERALGFGTTWRAGAGVRTYPLEHLMFELGVGFDRIGEDTFGGDTSDPYVGLEWQLPIRAPDWQLSVFVERAVSTTNTAGVRVSWGAGDTLRDRDRRLSWRPVR